MRIFIVDDLFGNRSQLRNVFQAEGHDVVVTAGERHDEVIKQVLKADPPFDAVVLDFQLTNSDTDGYLIAQALVQEGYDPARIIMHSNYSFSYFFDELREKYGVYHRPQKMNIEKLLACISGTCSCKTGVE